MAISTGAAILGSAVIGGVVQSRAAGDVASAGAGAAEAGIAEQRAGRLAFEERTQPFVDLGLAVQNPLLGLLGLQANPEFGSLDSEIAGIQSQIDAANRANQTGQQAISQAPVSGGDGEFGLRGILDRRRQQQAQTAFTPTDTSDLQAQLAELQSQRSGIEQFIPGDRAQGIEEINPIVSILRDQGFEQIQETAAARGRLGAGGTLKDLTRFSSDLATTVVPQLQQQKFNQLFNVLGLGANAATGQGQAALSTASNIGNLLGNQGAANAAGITGRTNAITGTLENLAGGAGAFPNLFNFGGGSPIAANQPVGSQVFGLGNEAGGGGTGALSTFGL